MRNYLSYILLILVSCSVLPSCGKLFNEKKIDEIITLRKTDKRPYGTYVAFENLNSIFPYADITVNKESPSRTNSFIEDYTFSTQPDRPKALYIIITPEFYPDQHEYEALMGFVEAGNHVFISTYSWGDSFIDSLKVRMVQPYAPVNYYESFALSIEHPVTHDSMQFTYPGLSDFTYIDSFDSNYASVLGRDQDKHPNLLRQTIQGGSITLQSDPLAYSNFFLLHEKNMSYYDETFSYFPKYISTIVWDQYFRYRENKDFNSLQVILANKSLNAAFWLALLLFALIYLFESKRKQRIIPIIKPHKNASLDFVKTVGRLYHQYHDNKNLGAKMTAHLSEYIRQKYNLSTSSFDEQFISRLAFKSGYPADKIKDMIYKAKMINDFSTVSDEELMEFHRQTEAFYKYQ